MKAPPTQQELEAFVARVQEAVTRLAGPATISLNIGRKYARIVKDERCAYGFIDLCTGDLLKAASWRSPALNFTRGNIRDPHLKLDPWSIT